LDISRLDNRLANDSYYMGHIANSILLLMKNALYPWFVIVPDTDETEFYKLASSQQVELLEQINQLSAFIINNFQIEKLNVATIGNVVAQMHIHVVGRHSHDACWPGVVWGYDAFTAYSTEQLGEIKLKLGAELTGFKS